MVLIDILNAHRQEMQSQFAKTTEDFIHNHTGNVAVRHRMEELTDLIIPSSVEAISDGEEVRGRGAIEAFDIWGPLNEPSEVNDRTDSSEAFIGEDRLKYLVNKSKKSVQWLICMRKLGMFKGGMKCEPSDEDP